MRCRYSKDDWFPKSSQETRASANIRRQERWAGVSLGLRSECLQRYTAAAKRAWTVGQGQGVQFAWSPPPWSWSTSNLTLDALFVYIYTIQGSEVIIISVKQYVSIEIFWEFALINCVLFKLIDYEIIQLWFYHSIIFLNQDFHNQRFVPFFLFQYAHSWLWSRIKSIWLISSSLEIAQWLIGRDLSVDYAAL